MIPPDLRLLGNFSTPADAQALRECSGRLGFDLPEQYADLLAEANGFLLDSGTKLYSVDEVVERNETFEVSTYAPGFLSIGDNSGGRAFILSLSDAETTVHSVGYGTLEPRYMLVVASDVAAWLELELRDQDDEN